MNLKFDLEEVEIEASQVSVWGLLIDELVVNAFKHAFKNTGAGILQVKLRKRSNLAELTIADNGPGISKNYDKNSSLGLSLIKFYAARLNARVKISNEKGTCYKFCFPCYKECYNTQSFF
ncbi:MAG TPA: ATP-binding protein [Balneolaceae bacterium]